MHGYEANQWHMPTNHAQCEMFFCLANCPSNSGAGFLFEQEFQDALCLRYGWRLSNVPDHCVCGSSFSANHAMICWNGGLTFVRHNEVILQRCGCGRFVMMLTKPPLQPLSGESISPTTAICGDDARVVLSP